MWLFTRYGMFSAVCAKTDFNPTAPPAAVDPNKVVVRSRYTGDLQRLLDAFPEPLEGAEIIKTPNRDYCCRVVVTRDAWAEVCAMLAMEMTYTNFKSGVAKHRGKDQYESALHRVWSVMYGYQREMHGPGIYDSQETARRVPGDRAPAFDGITEDTEVLLVYEDEESRDPIVAILDPDAFDSPEEAFSDAVVNEVCEVVARPDFERTVYAEVRAGIIPLHRKGGML